MSRFCCRSRDRTGWAVASARVTFTKLTFVPGRRRTVADGLLTFTEVPFNSCCCFVIITSLIVSVWGLEALTFSPRVTCSVALNANARMSFWNVRWERGSERADSHQRSVLSHDFFGVRPSGRLRCGQGARKVKSTPFSSHIFGPAASGLVWSSHR